VAWRGWRYALAAVLASLRRDRQAWPVHGALSLATVLAFAPASRAAPTDTDTTDSIARPSSEQCRTEALDFYYGLGPADAPTLLRVYIDPTAPETNPLRTWLEVRRIAGERAGDLRIELVPSRGGQNQGDAASDSVRVWFMAVASLGRAEEVLRLLDRQDWLRISTDLRSPEGQARLARELDLDAAAVQARRSGVPGECLRRDLDRASNRLAQQTMGQTATLVGVVDRDGREQFQYIDLELTELRTQLDRLITVPGFVEQSVGFIPFMPPIAPGIGAMSRFDRTFPNTGVLAGGEALPHRLVIFVEDEEHGRLPDWLMPAMKFRTAHPGSLSVQLIAAGVGSRAIGLRRRLCAARTLGLEVEYLLHLAEPPAVRRLHETELYELLQPVADSDQCSDSETLEPRPGEEEAALRDSSSRRGTDFGHPRGAWLDGRPVNPGDLDALEWQLDSEAKPSVIDWLLTPDTSSEPAPFEF
jgi:hypothetical protein